LHLDVEQEGRATGRRPLRYQRRSGERVEDKIERPGEAPRCWESTLVEKSEGTTGGVSIATAWISIAPFRSNRREFAGSAVRSESAVWQELDAVASNASVGCGAAC